MHCFAIREGAERARRRVNDSCRQNGAGKHERLWQLYAYHLKFKRVSLRLC